MALSTVLEMREWSLLSAVSGHAPVVYLPSAAGKYS